jgi:hypothetical protein
VNPATASPASRSSAATRSIATAPSVRATISTAIAPLLRGPRRKLVVLATFPQAAYLTVGEELVTLVTSDGIRHPNAVVLNLPSSGRPLTGLTVGQAGWVGGERLCVDHLDIRVARWWDPRPRLRSSSSDGIRSASEITRQRVHELTGQAPEMLLSPLATVVMAMQARDASGALTAADRLIGLGPGLTPSGDDVLAGLVSGTLVLAPSIAPVGPAVCDGREALDDLIVRVEEFGRAVAASALGHTTPMSAALLRHAARGRFAQPAADLVRAWTASSPRDEQIVRATDRLLAVGSSSGRDLALGLLAAADLVTDSTPPKRTS